MCLGATYVQRTPMLYPICNPIRLAKQFSFEAKGPPHLSLHLTGCVVGAPAAQYVALAVLAPPGEAALAVVDVEFGTVHASWRMAGATGGDDGDAARLGCVPLGASVASGEGWCLGLVTASNVQVRRTSRCLLLPTRQRGRGVLDVLENGRARVAECPTNPEPYALNPAP